MGRLSKRSPEVRERAVPVASIMSVPDFFASTGKMSLQFI
jgi:hypothetical protein